jgi:hypothetical protein
MREKDCWLVAGGWFVLREKYCWLVADKPSEQGANTSSLDLIQLKYELFETRRTVNKHRHILTRGHA